MAREAGGCDPPSPALLPSARVRGGEAATRPPGPSVSPGSDLRLRLTLRAWACVGVRGGACTRTRTHTPLSSSTSLASLCIGGGICRGGASGGLTEGSRRPPVRRGGSRWPRGAPGEGGEGSPILKAADGRSRGGIVSWDGRGRGGRCEEPGENHLPGFCVDSGRTAGSRLGGPPGSPCPPGWPLPPPPPGRRPGRLSPRGWNSALLHKSHGGALD